MPPADALPPPPLVPPGAAAPADGAAAELPSMLGLHAAPPADGPAAGVGAAAAAGASPASTLAPTTGGEWAAPVGEPPRRPGTAGLAASAALDGSDGTGSGGSRGGGGGGNGARPLLTERPSSAPAPGYAGGQSLDLKAGEPAAPDAPVAPGDAARRPSKLNVFKGMSKAAAAAAAKLTDSAGEVLKARQGSQGKNPAPTLASKGSRVEAQPGAGEDGEAAAAAAGGAPEEKGAAAAGEGGGPPEEPNAVRAERCWRAATGRGSLIHDLFRGQLESTIECQACKRRSTTCAPRVLARQPSAHRVVPPVVSMLLLRARSGQQDAAGGCPARVMPGGWIGFDRV